MTLQPGGSEQAPGVGELAAVLRAQNDDLSLYAGFLFNTLEAGLPPDLLRVERRGSLRDRMRGVTAPVVAMNVVVADREFSLRRDAIGATPQASVRHRVGGVVLRTDEVGLDAWVSELCSALVSIASRNEGVRRAVAAIVASG